MADSRLKPAEREFFHALERVVYGNPFSDARQQLIQQLLPGATLAQLAQDEGALARMVEPRLRPFLEAGKLESLGAEDRRQMEPAFAYVCYQRNTAHFDELIARELANREAPSADAIARSVIAELERFGVGEGEAIRYFAFFFQLRRAFHFIPRLTGRSEPMRRLRRALWDNIFTHDMRVYHDSLSSRMEDFSTLLLGETGTGKGEAAAAIGRSAFIPYLRHERRFATRFSEAFISINLSQYPESMLESELFGHRKGSFTGAIDHHAGVFERCNAHGALFLDEVGEVSVPVQIKLLRVLQDRAFTPLGSREPRRFAGRVIAATNRSWAELRAEERFRDDFYYRLCSDVIQVPTLRERISGSPSELEELVRTLVARISGSSEARLAAIVLGALERDVPRGYEWPGNVRELEQAVRRILLTGHYTTDPGGAATDGGQAFSELASSGQLSAKDLVGRYCAMLYTQLGTYAEVAARTGLDRRTARKYIVDYSTPATPVEP